MTDRIAPDTASAQSGSESLQRLTQFARDMGRMSNLSLVAERVLAGLSDVTGYHEGALFLLEHEHERYRRIVTHGSAQSNSTPQAISVQDPFVKHLSADQQILDRCSWDEHMTQVPHWRMLSDRLTNLSSTAAIPLVNKGRLVAFALLHSRQAAAPAGTGNMELLTAMAQSAANALDSILVYEDLRQSQTLMRRTDRLRSLEIIAGGFAHEIRNPLTSIKTFIQLAPERKDDAEFITDFSRIVLDDVHRIERLIEEILDYARYMEPKLTDEDLNDIVSSCVYFIEVKADSRGIKIEKELATELPRVMLDRQQIKQVLLNLLLNAMDAMGEQGGVLRLRTNKLMKPDGHLWVQVEIEDTGDGISADNLEHIFDPFFTTKHTSGENEGTGLGLTIAHQIIREHQGEIQVQSTEGTGTTFRINLPALL